MDAFVVALATLLTKLPAYYQDKEVPAERQARMGNVVAPAINDVGDRATCSGDYASVKCKRVWPGTKQDLVVLLVTKGFWESRFAVHVQAGKCGPRECDAYKDRNGIIVHRSASYWQVQENGLIQRREWKSMVGLEFGPTRRAAWAAAKVASAARKRCSRESASWEFVTISAYASGNSCSWHGAYPRVKFMAKIKSKFRTLRDEAAAAEKAAQVEPKKDGESS